MSVSGKVWGRTRVLIRMPFVEMHWLSIKANARCSMHKHNFKANAFVCVKGRLFIDVRKNDYNLVDTTELGPREIMSVKAGEYHRFRTGSEPCEAIEFYTPELLSEDIIREDVGGIIGAAT